jgi:hypothetical protein
MKNRRLIASIFSSVILIALQGCADMNSKKNANSMRIWISPEYRQSVKVDQHGYTYVVVKR